MQTRLLFIYLFISLFFNLSQANTDTKMKPDTVNITLLATSDLHGTFIPWDYASDTENKAGSLSQVATQIKAIRADTNNVILVDVGDLIQGNFIETFKEDEISPMVQGLNALNYDIWVPGNHEFDFGLPVLERAMHQFKGSILAANIIRDDKTPYLPAYKIIEKQGVKIGIIGVTTPMTAEFAKGTDRIKGIQFTNPTEATQQAIKALSGQVDAIILISHMGLDNENHQPNTGNTDIALANPEIDAIFAGHMHVKIDKAQVNNVILTEPGKYGEALSRIDLTFEKQNDKYQLRDKNSLTYSMKAVASDPALEQIFSPFHQVLRKNTNLSIAQLTGANLVPATRVKGIPQVQIQDSGISALFQEAAQYYAPEADVIALQIDNDFAKLDIGDIRIKDIAFNYQYKAGEITVFQLTGKELKTYMEWAAGYFNQVNDGDVTYSFNPKRRSSKYSTNDFFGGVTYRIDLAQPEGQRIQNLKLADGTIVTDSTPIKLGMNAYRMSQLTAKNGVLADQTFPILLDTKAKYGEDDGTIRQMTIRYLTDVKKGQYVGQPMNRWEISGLKGYERERQIVEKLLNDDQISVIKTADGRFSNIAAFNVKDKLFADITSYQAAIADREQKMLTASPIEKKHIEDDITIIKAINPF